MRLIYNDGNFCMTLLVCDEGDDFKMMCSDGNDCLMMVCDECDDFKDDDDGSVFGFVEVKQK